MKNSDWPIQTTLSKSLRAVICGLPFLFALSLTACDSEPEVELVENGYPTLARVEYVLQCMEKNGGQNLDSLYPCACSIDKIASVLPYDDFAEAQTFTAMRSAPGEAGGLFRDPPRAKELRNKLEEAESTARKNCFVKHVKADGAE